MDPYAAESLTDIAHRLRRVAHMQQHGVKLSAPRLAELLHQEADLLLAVIEQGQLSTPTLVPAPEPRWQVAAR